MTTFLVDLVGLMVVITVCLGILYLTCGFLGIMWAVVGSVLALLTHRPAPGRWDMWKELFTHNHKEKDNGSS